MYIRHAGLVTKDMDKAIRFYRDLLGFRIEKDNNEKSGYVSTILGMKDAEVRTVKLSDGRGALIELLYYRRPTSKSRIKSIHDIGYSHLAVTVDDIGREYKRLSKEGVAFVSAPQASPDGYAKVAFCKDPDGAFVELVEVLGKRKVG